MSEKKEEKNETSLVVKKYNNEIPDWHKQQELILKRWSEIGSSYRYLHDKAFQKYTTQNLWFALPVIIISTITGTANFAQGSFPDNWKTFVPLGIGFLNLAAGLITTIAQFLKVSELLEGHRAASLAYSKFSRNISVELSLPVKERTDDGSNFINNCRTELDRLIEQSPNVPEGIIKSFMKRFPEPEYDDKGKPSNNYDFFRPEILDIRPINIYRDDKAEEARKKAKELKEKQEFAEKERERIKKEIENDKKIREKIKLEAKKEFEALHKKQNKELDKIIELAKIKTKKELLTRKYSTTNVEESMADVLNNLKSNIDEISDDTDDSDNSDSDNDGIAITINDGDNIDYSTNNTPVNTNGNPENVVISRSNVNNTDLDNENGENNENSENDQNNQNNDNDTESQNPDENNDTQTDDNLINVSDDENNDH